MLHQPPASSICAHNRGGAKTEILATSYKPPKKKKTEKKTKRAENKQKKKNKKTPRTASLLHVINALWQPYQRTGCTPRPPAANAHFFGVLQLINNSSGC